MHLSPAARFSPDDKFSRQRLTLKKRFGLLLTQQPAPPLWYGPTNLLCMTPSFFFIVLFSVTCSLMYGCRYCSPSRGHVIFCVCVNWEFCSLFANLNNYGKRAIKVDVLFCLITTRPILEPEVVVNVEMQVVLIPLCSSRHEVRSRCRNKWKVANNEREIDFGNKAKLCTVKVLLCACAFSTQ